MNFPGTEMQRNQLVSIFRSPNLNRDALNFAEAVRLNASLMG